MRINKDGTYHNEYTGKSGYVKPPEYAGDWYRLYGDDYGLAQDLSYKQNMDSAKRQEDFQMFMSNTSHVREVNDLLAAGINPILSANNGASTGQGAYANVDTSASSAKLAEKQLNKQLENQTKIENMKIANEQKIADQNRQMQYQIAQDQIASQQYINKYNTDMSFALGTYQSDNNLRGTTYSADSARQSSMYGTDIAYKNSADQRAWQAGQYKLERDWSTDERIASQKWNANQNMLNRRVTKYGINRGYQASVYGANSAYGAAKLSADAQRYSSKLNYDSSIYVADKNFENSEAQRAWDAMHPNNKWQAGGTAIETINKWFKNWKKNHRDQYNEWSKGESSAS